ASGRVGSDSACLGQSARGERSSRCHPRRYAGDGGIRTFWRSLILFAPDVVTEQDVLIAQVEPAVSDHRMGPGPRLASLGLLETALLAIAFRRRLDKRHLAAGVTAHVQSPIGVADRRRSHAAIGPHLFAGR